MTSGTWPWFALLTPVMLVWVVGAIVAATRWRSCPGPSACVLGSVACMIVAFIAWQFGASWILSDAGALTSASITTQMTVLAITIVPIRLAGWIALLSGVCGWRAAHTPGTRQSPFQFRIAHLLVVTLLAALVCGLGRGLVSLLGSQAVELLTLVDEIPIVVVWLVGLYLAVSRFRLHPPVSVLAGIGWGTMLASLVFFQLAWMVMTQFGSPPYNRFLLVNLVGIIASAAGWALLIGAALGWRDTIKPDVGSVPFKQS